ncbi:MAG: phosphate acyltransferase PlsX [Clostridiales bacterium]|nr:phosphate acyltransferase PlsX [Clostridiales bacterium]
METVTRVAVDAMGGDNAPGEIVKGALDAVNSRKDVHVFLVGKKDAVAAELDKAQYPKEQIEIVDAPEVIEMAEHPVNAIRTKKQSSMVVGMNLVKNGDVDAFISAGNSGAILVGGQTIVGRMHGIKRAPLAPIVPTDKGIALILDCGANVDARPEHLVEFAQMGSIYMEYVIGVKNPRVAIVNIGEEEEKGNELVKETFPLLRDCPGINFTGSIEAREIPHGGADVIVCEAFVGNVILKLYEGVGVTMMDTVKDALMTSLRSKIGALFAMPALRKSFKPYLEALHTGAPLLGLNGLVVKTHGSSKAIEIKNAIGQCVTFREENINGIIKERITGAQQEEA